MRPHLFVVAAALLSASLVAHADTSQVFDLSGTLSSAATNNFGGTVTIDTTTGAVTNGDFTITEAGTPYVFTGVPTENGVDNGQFAFSQFVTGSRNRVHRCVRLQCADSLAGRLYRRQSLLRRRIVSAHWRRDGHHDLLWPLRE